MANSLKRYDFGYTNLSENLGDIDLVQIAKNLGIATRVTRIRDGEEIVEITPATLVQLNPFVTDVSSICTPIELQQLLFCELEDILQISNVVPL